jgi:D-sedoheptulose 7-phosphate isomerase
MLELLITAFQNGGKLLLCGNGGSAADVEHITGELMKGFMLPRPIPEAQAVLIRSAEFPDAGQLASGLQQGLPVIPLTSHPALTTAILNDLNPMMLFAHQVYVLGRSGDMAMGLSTSGNSTNVINALKIAKALGLYTGGLCGAKSCKMDEVCDCVIHVPETEAYKVQELHLPIYHTLCLGIETEFFG